jgi:hypothetical protein
MVEEVGRPIVSEEGIEGLDVGVDGQLKGRIGGMVGRRVPKEVLSAKCVEFVIPRRVSAFGGHFASWKTKVCGAL